MPYLFLVNVLKTVIYPNYTEKFNLWEITQSMRNIKMNNSIIIRGKFGIYYEKLVKHVNKFCGKIQNFLISLNVTQAITIVL